MSTNSRLLRSKYTCEDLRSKLSYCGCVTADFYQSRCNSFSCQSCRHRRARTTAGLVAEWSVGVRSLSRIQRIDLSTNGVDHPAALVEEMRYLRSSIAEIIDNRSRTNPKWAGIRYYLMWSPCFENRNWSARLRGVIYTDLLSSTNYVDAFERMSISRSQAMITPFPGQSLVPLPISSLREEVHDWMMVSMTDVTGLNHCDDASISAICNEIYYASENKVLLARRGFSAS